MSRILFTWELGSGRGHVTRIRPLAMHLAGAGHQVFFACNQHHFALGKEVFSDCRIPLLAAPVHPAEQGMPVPISFAHILLNCGFARAQQLLSRVEQWQKLFNQLQPDVIVADHSPTALLAANGRRERVVVMGTGFECPPDVAPLPSLRPELAVSDDDLKRIEAPMLETINRVSHELGGCPYERIAEIYSRADGQLLLTYPELDPYSDVRQGTYFGAYLGSHGCKPEWPDTPGPRLLVYLRVTEILQLLLEAIGDRPCSAIIAGKDVNPLLAEKYQDRRFRFVFDAVDLGALCAEADLVILNGGHASTAQALYAGKPILVIPMSLEQGLTGRRIEDTGSGVVAADLTVPGVAGALNEIVDSKSKQTAAEEFAEKYRSNTDEEWIVSTADSIRRFMA